MEADYQPKPKVIEHPERNPSEGFDLRTHIKDAKTGKLIRVQPYTRRVVNSVVYYERPVGSGNLFFESGLAAGRRIPDSKDAKGNVTYKIDEQASHIEYVASITQERTMDGVVDENEALRKELAALKAEKEMLEKAQTAQKKA